MSDATKFMERFEAFARSMPADEGYPWSSNTCALAQFGYPGAVISNLQEKGIPEKAYRAAVHCTTGKKPEGWSTFGALADRLAKLREAAAKARGQS
jgi:hypothetical protein